MITDYFNSLIDKYKLDLKEFKKPDGKFIKLVWNNKYYKYKKKRLHKYSTLYNIYKIL